MNIVYEDIVLRAIERDDLHLLKEMMNDPEIENMVGGYSFPVSSKDQESWYTNLSNHPRELRTVIQTAGHGAVGTAMLTDIDWKNRTAQFHFKITGDSQARGNGYGVKAIRAMVKYAFEQLNLHCIYSNILEYNQVSQRVHQKCGFRKECILRDRIFKNGKMHNLTIWSIINGELIEKE